MKFEIEVVGRTIVAKDETGKIIGAGSPREVAEALKMRFKLMLPQAEA